MKRKESTTIGTSSYTVEMLGGVTGRSILLRVLRVASPMLASADGIPVEDRLSKVVSLFTADDLTALCDAFAAVTRVRIADTSKPGGAREPLLSHEFDEHFAGAYDEMAQWLVFCLKLNFASVFSLAAGALANPPAAAPTPAA